AETKGVAVMQRMLDLLEERNGTRPVKLGKWIGSR
ncbi:MAG: hypothetical protein K0R28_4306, partial [Paenibacillus sp.]|nr:hypothetical protein [Paenibacillus sp.]